MAYVSFSNFLLFGLVLLLLHRMTVVVSVDSPESKCPSLTDYIARWTSSALYVFEGQLNSISPITSDGTPPSIIVSFAVSSIPPSDLPVCQEQVKDVQLLTPDRNYLIFANRSGIISKSSLSGQASSVFYLVSKFPQMSTKVAVDQVRIYSCAKCGKIKLKLAPKDAKLKPGQKFQLKCQIVGKPTPVIKWYKNKHLVTVDEHVNVTVVRQVSHLVINKASSSDVGSYHCQAINPLLVTNSSTSNLRILAATNETNEGHAARCSTSGFCLNRGQCFMLKSLGRKYCRCPTGYQGDRCEEHIVPDFKRKLTDSTHSLVQSAQTDQTFIISGIAIGTLVVAGVTVAIFCLVRTWCNRKDRRRRAPANVYRPPSLPDGHIFNVNQLHAAINQSATEYSNLSRNSAAFTSFESGDILRRPVPPGQPAIRNHDQPVIRRENRSSSSFAADVEGPRRTSSFQIQLQRLSMHSSSSQQLQPLSSRQRLPVISATPDSERLEAEMSESRDQRHDSHELESVRSRRTSETTEREVQIAHGQIGPTRGDSAAVSPRSSQCSHTESLLCGTAPRQIGEQAASSVNVPAWYTTTNGSGVSDSLDSDDDRNAIDLEVNFESEADILGVETSGDELDRCGTSRDFSELSSQLTERGISDDDGGGSSPSGSDEGNHRRLLSGSDLSWDESADLPSFVVGAGLNGMGTELGGLLQFGKT